MSALVELAQFKQIVLVHPGVCAPAVEHSCVAVLVFPVVWVYL